MPSLNAGKMTDRGVCDIINNLCVVKKMNEDRA